MILGIKTADRTAELVLFHEGVVARDIWDADREMAKGLLARIETVLTHHKSVWGELQGIVAYQGPGSFTGLRIGLTTANSIAYSLQLPIVSSTGETWLENGIEKLQRRENDGMILPEYGADPRITSPRK